MLNPRPAPVAQPADDAAWPAELDAAYRAHASWLIAFLRRRFGRDLAEDLAQETFLRLSRAPVAWRSPKAVLARAALNAAQDHLRRENAQRRPRLVADGGAADGGAADGVSLPDQFESVLHHEIVAALPRDLRDVYCLSRFAGMTYEEIAAHTGISVKAVEKRMTKALKLCLAQLRS